MVMEPSDSKGRDRILSSLDIAIEGLNLAKEVSSITPAKALFGSASILLTMIKVSFTPGCVIEHLVHGHSGLDSQRRRLYRPWAILRRNLSNPRPGIERKKIR